MKMKKLASTVLAGVMALSMTTAAFAADVTDLTEGAELEVTGSTQGATISLTVPSSAAVVVNPYKIAVDIPGSDPAAQSSDQVVSPVYYVVNNSSLAIEVGVSMVATVEGDVKLVATSGAAATGTDKNLFAFLDLQAVKDNATTPTWTAAAAFDATKDTQILLDTTAKTGKLSLKATDGTTNTALDTMAFKFIGTANDKAGAPWTAEDTVSATIAFTFTVDNT